MIGRVADSITTLLSKTISPPKRVKVKAKANVAILEVDQVVLVPTALDLAPTAVIAQVTTHAKAIAVAAAAQAGTRGRVNVQILPPPERTTLILMEYVSISYRETVSLDRNAKTTILFHFPLSPPLLATRKKRSPQKTRNLKATAKAGIAAPAVTEVAALIAVGKRTRNIDPALRAAVPVLQEVLEMIAAEVDPQAEVSLPRKKRAANHQNLRTGRGEERNAQLPLPTRPPPAIPMVNQT